jgi:phenylalanyl-tRNA synthetase beta subunit
VGARRRGGGRAVRWRGRLGRQQPCSRTSGLFDAYTGEQAGEANKSLACKLRFGAPDRTLTDEEVTTARDAAVAEAGRRVGAVLRAAS